MQYFILSKEKISKSTKVRLYTFLKCIFTYLELRRSQCADSQKIKII